MLWQEPEIFQEVIEAYLSCNGIGTMCNMTMNAVYFEILKQREIIPRT